MKPFIISLIALISLDGCWLGFIAGDFYQQQLSHLMAESFPEWPFLIFYPLYAFGTTVFVIKPALATKSLRVALWRGALFGAGAYAAYDLTNQATLRNWPFLVTVVDLLWGIVVTTAASAIAYAISSLGQKTITVPSQADS